MILTRRGPLERSINNEGDERGIERQRRAKLPEMQQSSKARSKKKTKKESKDRRNGPAARIKRAKNKEYVNEKNYDTTHTSALEIIVKRQHA